MKPLAAPIAPELPPSDAAFDHTPKPAVRAVKLTALSGGAGLKPRDPPPTTDEVRNMSCPAADLPAHVEQQLIDAIVRPLCDGETRQDGNARREREIVALVATLSSAQAFRLGARIDNAYSNDPICVALKRLISDRRKRLRDAIDEHRRALAQTAWAARR